MPLARMRASICLRSASLILKLIVGGVVLIAHRKAPFIVGVAAGTVKHPQATFDYSFLVVKADYICHGLHR